MLSRCVAHIVRYEGKEFGLAQDLDNVLGEKSKGRQVRSLGDLWRSKNGEIDIKGDKMASHI